MADYPKLPMEVLDLLGQVNGILAKELAQLVSFTVISPDGLITHLLASFEDGLRKPQYRHIKAGYVQHLHEHADKFMAGGQSLGPSGGELDDKANDTPKQLN